MSTSKDGLFSIGEVSKIMGVNIKSLHYYDRIGILPPAVIDDKTGYRYYKPSQLGIISAIQVCVELGIPLHNFPNYYTSGRIHASRFLEDALRISEQRISAIQESIRFIEELKAEVSKADELLAHNGICELDCQEECYYVQEIDQDISLLSFNKVLGQIHLNAVEQGIRTSLRFGKLAVFHQHDIKKLYAFLGVAPGTQGKHIIVLPAGSYKVLHSGQDQLNLAPELFPSLFAKHKKLIVIESELISSTYRPENPCYELKCRMCPED